MKVRADEFASFLVERYARKDGYIMGATGQCPRKWKDSSWWINQYVNDAKKYAKAKYWRDHAERVWDCQGLAEGYYKDMTGTDVNTKARYNYMEWCEPKGQGLIPAAYRVPGAAVFWGKKPESITHVAFLVTPVEEGKDDGDWYMVEARSVLLGVCKTKLLSRKPEWWGLMTKYYDYSYDPPIPGPEDCPYPMPVDIISRFKNRKGDGVRWVQWHLLKWDPDCLPKYGIDGVFGKETDIAVREFQKDKRLAVDGKVGVMTRAALVYAASSAELRGISDDIQR